MEINLISDTVTRPTPEMLAYMQQVEVGDDVYGADPTVNLLQQTLASLFGQEAALFFPSGTMANQTALQLHTRPGEAVICDKDSHIIHYEAGGMAAHSGLQAVALDGNRGKITAEQVRAAFIPSENIHTTPTTLVALENTTNRGGGACYETAELEAISETALELGLKRHLDGARLWNALVATGQDPKAYGRWFDTISVCLSKGLGAPVGSVLVGSHTDIQKALRIRKRLGGAMRQVGYLAAAGLYALQHHVTHLEDDHRRAAELGTVLARKQWVKAVEPVSTNIVIFRLQDGLSEQRLIDKLKSRNIHISALAPGKLRIVTHRDYRQIMHNYVLEVLQGFEFNA